MTENTRETWGYVRLSVDIGQSGLENQAAEVRALADRKGWELPEERLLRETARAYDRARGVAVRPQFLKILERAEAHPEQIRIVVYNLDRLVRDLKDFIRLREVADRGCEVVAVTGNLDLSSSIGRMTAGVVVSVKEFEIEELTRRVRANKKHAKSRGKYLGVGHRTFGYTDATADRKVNEQEAEVLKWVVTELREHDRGWRSLADELKSMGVRTPQGKYFTQQNLPKTLESAAIYGRMVQVDENGSKKLLKAPWEAIFPMSVLGEVQQIRKARNAYEGSRDVGSLLSGAATCGACGGRMSSAGPRKYRCRSDYTICNNTIKKQDTDALIEKMLLLRLRDWKPKMSDAVKGLDLSAEESRRAEIESLLKSGIISESMAEVGLTEVQTSIDLKIQAHERNSRNLPEWMETGETILEHWDGLTMREKRDTVREVFKSIQILPFDVSRKGAFYPERVLIEY